MFALMLAAAAAVGGTSADEQRMDRAQAVCKASYGYDAMKADLAAGDTGLTPRTDALIRGRFEIALERNGMANISQDERNALRVMCNFYMRGTEDAINGVLHDYVPAAK